MHSSRTIIPMRQKQKFREGAAPVSKKMLRVEHQEDDQDQDVIDLTPYWDEVLEQEKTV